MAGNFICNMAVLGKTGVGKSCLLNYLCGTNFKAGAGKPVTGMGLYESMGTLNGQKVRVFDSWGIEPDKVNEWNALLDKEKRKHNATLPPSDWFHAVVYCVQAGGDRVEDIDAEIIKEFMDEGYRVVAALTKSTQNGSARQNEMIHSIETTVARRLGGGGMQIVRDRLEVVPVCSVEKTLRNGVTTTPFGKEALAKAILDGWHETVLCRLPAAVIERLKVRVHTFVDNKIDALNTMTANGQISGNIDSGIDREVVENFYSALENFVQTLFQKEYSGMVVDLLDEARDIEEGLIRAMGIYNAGGGIAINGLTTFKSIVQSEVTAGTWVARIFSLGIAAIVGRFSSRAQGKARDLIEAQFREGESAAYKEIDAQLPQVKADIQSLLNA